MDGTIIPIDIDSGIKNYLGSQKRSNKTHVNRISALGDPCLRRLYYMRAEWDKAKNPEQGLAGIFATGSELEPIIQRIVSQVGMSSTPRWRLIKAQSETRSELLESHQISGTIDGVLEVEKSPNEWTKAGVVDIKTMSPNIYPQIDKFEDLQKYPWTAKYPGQLMLYAKAEKEPTCHILAINKTNLFDMKFISFPVDEAYVSTLLEKADKVNQAVTTKTAPDGVNDIDECGKCPWYSFCCPSLTTGEELTIDDSEELAGILDAMASIEAMVKQYEGLKKERDALLKPYEGKPLLCANWMIQWKKIARKGYVVQDGEYWNKKIIRTDKTAKLADAPKKSQKMGALSSAQIEEYKKTAWGT
jgi:CRISPR/Cas system-associated exonuclease Cas4 (RecB family)